MSTARDLMRPCSSVAETATVAQIVARKAADPEYVYAVLDARGELRKQLPVAQGKRLVGVVCRVDVAKRVLG